MTIPLILQRSSGSRVLGAVTYIVIVPFVSIFLAIFLYFPIAVLLEACGVPKDQQGIAYLPLLVLVGLGVSWWSYRDFNRRAFLEVLIDRERVHIKEGSKKTEMMLDNVDSVVLSPKNTQISCRLVDGEGKSLTLPLLIASYPVVRKSLEEVLLPKLVDNLDARLKSGQLVCVRDSTLRGYVRIFHGLCMVIFAPFLIVSIRFAQFAPALIQSGFRLMRQGRRAIGGGFYLSQGGVTQDPNRDFSVHEWTDLRRSLNDNAGMHLDFDDGRCLSASSFAENYWVAAFWLQREFGNSSAER